MIRGLLFLILLVAMAWGATWLADRPGSVTLEWMGWRVDTSFPILAGVVVFMIVLGAMLYRAWLFIRRVPQNISKTMRENKSRRGYAALNRGLVALAAGDVNDARKQAARADGLLGDPPMTLLLKAQAAQLSGDDIEAEKYFRAMCDVPETEFLGLRGLANEALKRGDYTEALALVTRAKAVNPKSEWVLSTLFDLQARGGDWFAAGETLKLEMRHKCITPAAGRRRQAVIALQNSQDAQKNGQIQDALKLAQKAVELDIEFIAATAQYGAMLLATGSERKAAKVIEKAWLRTPHPDLLELYWRARKADDGMAKVNATQKLRDINPHHLESVVGAARAAVEASLWGEARGLLDRLLRDGTRTARIYRLMAELAEREDGTPVRAHEFLRQASQADADPVWVCGDCGHRVPAWQAHCPGCHGFDTLGWTTPPGSTPAQASQQNAAGQTSAPNGRIGHGSRPVNADVDQNAVAQ